MSIILAISLLSCQSENKVAAPATTPEMAQEASVPNQHTLVLLDKTLSLTDTALMAAQLPKLLAQVQSYLQHPGDRIQVSFVHGNTLGVNPALDTKLEWEVTGVEELSKMGGRDREQAKEAMNAARRKQQTAVIQALRAAYHAPNPEKTNQVTDLWGSVELMTRFFKDAPSNAQRRVIIVSDMVEAVSGSGRRNFHRQPPQNKDEAEVWAAADREWIERELVVSEDALNDVEIYLYRPLGSMTASDFQQLRYYWNALFGSWGMRELTEASATQIN